MFISLIKFSPRLKASSFISSEFEETSFAASLPACKAAMADSWGDKPSSSFSSKTDSASSLT